MDDGKVVLSQITKSGSPGEVKDHFLAAFLYNPRFPGQYYMAETGLTRTTSGTTTRRLADTSRATQSDSGR
jgi:hypothetical protein